VLRLLIGDQTDASANPVPYEAKINTQICVS